MLSTITHLHSSFYLGNTQLFAVFVLFIIHLRQFESCLSLDPVRVMIQNFMEQMGAEEGDSEEENEDPVCLFLSVYSIFGLNYPGWHGICYALHIRVTARAYAGITEQCFRVKGNNV